MPLFCYVDWPRMFIYYCPTFLHKFLPLVEQPQFGEHCLYPKEVVKPEEVNINRFLLTYYVMSLLFVYCLQEKGFSFRIWNFLIEKKIMENMELSFHEMPGTLQSLIHSAL